SSFLLHSLHPRVVLPLPYTTLFRSALALQALHPQLVGQHLNRSGQVQRAEVRVRGDMHMEFAALQLIAGEARILPAEYQRDRPRSEEHTSELQSRFDFVCRLLLEII